MTISERFVRILAIDSKDPGVRLKVEHALDELTYISEERVLPEKIADPDANHVAVLTDLWLTDAGVRWLHASLGKLISVLDAENPMCSCGHAADVHMKMLAAGDYCTAYECACRGFYAVAVGTR